MASLSLLFTSWFSKCSLMFLWRAYSFCISRNFFSNYWNLSSMRVNVWPRSWASLFIFLIWLSVICSTVLSFWACGCVNFFIFSLIMFVSESSDPLVWFLNRSFIFSIRFLLSRWSWEDSTCWLKEKVGRTLKENSFSNSFSFENFLESAFSCCYYGGWIYYSGGIGFWSCMPLSFGNTIGFAAAGMTPSSTPKSWMILGAEFCLWSFLFCNRGWNSSWV